MRRCAVWIFLAACGGTGGGGGYGYSGPTLEVTVDGVHLGPAAPDPGSSASLDDTRSGALVTSSQFQAMVGSQVAGATCQLGFQKFGDSVSPIGALSYQVMAASTAATPDGTVSPLGGERVLTGGDSWSCTGSSCDGGLFVLTAVDARHAEGYFSGTLSSDRGGPPASVVCSFYVPMAAYAP